MSSRNKIDVKKLFEFWGEVTRAHGVDRSTRTGAAAPTGVIVESFPESYRDEKTIADIPAFAFPCDFSCDSVQSYSFVLTTDDSKWRYGFCRHDPKTDSAMVIITFLPWHDTFLRLLSVLAELRRTNSSEFRTFLAEAYNRGIPDPGGSLTFFYNGAQSPFVFERPLQFQLPSIPENQMLSLYYNFVDPKNMIAVFAAMLAERRIIFTSRRLDRLSSCIQAANAFLYPMVWQHIFIPVLPMKLKDYLSAPMPYLIGVPEMVLETMTPDELGEVVILYCDTKILESPFDDVHEMPAEIISQLKKQLTHSHEHLGDRVSKIFLGALVQLIGGYRDAVEFRDSGKTFNRDKFIETRPVHLRPFLAKMMQLQIFQQFIDERIDMLNTGLGFSDEFEMETVRYAEKMKKRGKNYAFLKNVKDKTNPAVKSAVKSVKEGSRGVKTAYKDLKSKLRDITPPNSSNPHFRSHLSATNSQHDRIDGFVGAGGKSSAGHHSAPSSPIFNNRTHHRPAAGGFQYAAPAAITGAGNAIRKAPPLAISASSSHIQPNGYVNYTTAPAQQSVHHAAASPTVSPASSICSSEMNLSQELQNHPLFKSPIVDRSLKPSISLELNHRTAAAARTGGGAPPAFRPQPPASTAYTQPSMAYRTPHATPSVPAAAALPPSYYNHPYVTAQHQQPKQPPPPQPPPPSQSNQPTPIIHPPTYPHVASKPPPAPRPKSIKSNHSDNNMPNNNNKIVTTDSIFDTPPDMLSPPVPPVPPRRWAASGVSAAGNPPAVIALGINKLQRNCWDSTYHAYRALHKTLPDVDLRDSSSSNTSASSSSSTSFVSATSTFSQQRLCHETPVPAPRLKKECLRSLQPHHWQQPAAANSLNSVASSSCVSHEDTMNDLISLDDSHNTSFDLEDFDPLNQNARPLPSLSAGGSGGKAKTKSTTLPSGTSPALISTTASVSNPLYPYYTPQRSCASMMPPTTKPPPPPVGVQPYDDDFELLRKYGLDQFTLRTSVSATATPNTGRVFRNNAAATPNVMLQSTAAPSSASMSKWTTFD